MLMSKIGLLNAKDWLESHLRRGGRFISLTPPPQVSRSYLPIGRYCDSSVECDQQLHRAERGFQRSLCLPDLVQVPVRSTEICPRLHIVAQHISHELDAL